MSPSVAVGRLAAKEIAAHLRSWWILIMGLLFGALSWLIGSFGFSFTGGELQQQTVLVSFVHLQLYLVPLLGLLLAYDGILGEREAGTFDLHLSMGIGNITFLAGKWCGLFLSLWLVLLPSMAIQLYAFVQSGGELAVFIRFAILTGLLAGSMISVGLALSSFSTSRGTVVSLCFASWILFALVIDFAILGILTLTEGAAEEWIVHTLMMAHPLGLFRLASYLIFFPAEVVHLTGGAVLEPAPTLAILVAWLPLPLAAAWIRLSRMYAPIRWDVD